MDDYDTEAVPGSKTSKFNSGFLINMRLDALWKDAHKHSRCGQYASWNSDLDRVWCELAGDEDEGSEKEKKFNLINKKFEIAGEPFNIAQIGFKVVTPEAMKKIKKVYIVLVEKEIFLRRLQNEQGKGTAYDEADDYMYQ